MERKKERKALNFSLPRDFFQEKLVSEDSSPVIQEPKFLDKSFQRPRLHNTNWQIVPSNVDLKKK